ncbi:protein bunched, class 2/F/G isoform-like [Daktulosphaira vitifoliae]|uniref:protein bunched, class 2/F/G isoform-like n=1 Tax=Daktulosphaira vitifoliae TaxID=58002 RepID=UPI0021A9870A|nr:protein bunched, class 2/F/G isoform-like [Daktulosphaira vitifoliae]
MSYKMFSIGLVFTLASMCLAQTHTNSPSQYQTQSLSQSTFQNGPAVQTQTRLEDIERDFSSTPSSKPQQSFGKTPQSATPSFQAQQQLQQPPNQILGYPQPQYYIQPYQGQQQLLAQQFPTAFDFPGIQYMFINPAAFNTQQYYVQAPQPSAIPQYVTKQSSSSALLPSTSSPLNKLAPSEFKPQFVANDPALASFKQQGQFVEAAPSLANFKQQQGQFVEAAPSLANFKQQQGQFVETAPASQYVQQPQAAVPPSEFAFITHHPTTPQVKSVLAPNTQQQIQYTAIPQQYQQPQFYVNLPSVPQQPQQSIVSFNSAPVEQARIQPSLKSEFSSGIKSTTALPTKTSEFAYKFESTPQQPQQANNGAYSTLRFSN